MSNWLCFFPLCPFRHQGDGHVGAGAVFCERWEQVLSEIRSHGGLWGGDVIRGYVTQRKGQEPLNFFSFYIMWILNENVFLFLLQVIFASLHYLEEALLRTQPPEFDSHSRSHCFFHLSSSGNRFLTSGYKKSVNYLSNLLCMKHPPLNQLSQHCAE